MDIKIKFFFWLASVIVLFLASIGNSFKVGKRGMVLMPLGLLLFVFPFMWDQGVAAF